MPAPAPAQTLLPEIAALLPASIDDTWTYGQVKAVEDLLIEQGTFHFPRLETGLFAAATSAADDFHLTGYQNVWVRDNVHVAHGHFLWGEQTIAVQDVQALLAFFATQKQRLVNMIEGRTTPDQIQQRPHIRFNGRTLTENSESWSHAQNDALGYFLWLTSRLATTGQLELSIEQAALLNEFPHYFQAIDYTTDEDSGHWEEERKVEASSIGVVVAALKQWAVILDEHPKFRTAGRGATSEFCSQLVHRGEDALARILPYECRQENSRKARAVDAALLFLIWPLQVTTEPMARTIVANVSDQLAGPYGIRRYLGDSYWCADYRTLVSAEKRSTDYSEDQSARDQLLKKGFEAQWCLFDPIISIIAGEWYRAHGQPEDLALQKFHLLRGLTQLTPPESRFGPYKCPESYFCEAGTYIPNDITPLLWTQANLRLALVGMLQSLST
ncbi:glycoside hydrolase family 15 protein [Planctopirus hydrillae]|uniref:glycoside hydrolase family 15 protein n=1 Tax=Planctopirus hydrillae TaxID=1841610 RepID=UPI0009F4A36C|nr:glycoside hydrolase family 15 protein [Planctopirus hydrillae]